MEGPLNQSLERFREVSADCSEYPFDSLQQVLSSVFLGQSFDDKKSPKELCELLLDKYKDVWYHGLTFFRNVLVVSSVGSDSIPPRDAHLIKIRRAMDDNRISSEVAITRVFLLLEKIKRPTPQVMELDALCTLWVDKKQSSYRLQFKNSWAELLRCCGSVMNRDLLVKLLRIIPDSVMPFIGNPELFAGFFTECFRRDNDLEISLLSVSGLFHLISRHNLGEPTDLYARLYTLISPQTMKKAGQSNRVFQLLVKALRSPLMPSQYVGVFAKKLLRVAVLVESPSMALWLVVSAFNLMQAHPIISKPLLHRDMHVGMLSTDPFDLACTQIETMIPVMSGSSLWEIETLLNHSDPSIVRMANLFKSNFFSRKAKTVSNDDYLLISDEQLFNRERKYGSHSKVKKSRGEVELDGIIGEENARMEQQISIAAPIKRELSDLFDNEFLRQLQRAFPAC